MDNVPEHMGLHNTETEIKGVSRYAGAKNIYKYTREQLVERKRHIKQMSEDYPNVSYHTCEMVYDVISNMQKEEVDEIISKGLWEKPSQHNRPHGGVVKSGLVYESDGVTLVKEEK